MVAAHLVHCAGPFRYLPLNPLRAAIEAGVDYIDIAEDREYARRVHALAPAVEAAGITALNGHHPEGTRLCLVWKRSSPN